jgi:hypothetical protein
MAALATPLATSVEDYLHSVYEPDMDLVDGVLEDRNVGEFGHWKIQRALLLALIGGKSSAAISWSGKPVHKSLQTDTACLTPA